MKFIQNNPHLSAVAFGMIVLALALLIAGTMHPDLEGWPHV